MDGVVMLDRFRDTRGLLLALPLVLLAPSCTCTGGEVPIPEQTSSSSSSGTGGADLGPCGIDCSQLDTPECTVAVCNTGEVLGPLFTCIVIAAPKNTPCDDGKFCTLGDTCDGGSCVGGPQNNCGIKPDPCSAITCFEDSKSCDVTPVNDGSPCTPTNLCQVNGVCKIGECIGQPKDCSFSPLSECNVVGCEPATGKCVGTPDPNKDNRPCVLTGDLCNIKRTCQNGQCSGGEPKDCSALTAGCQLGVCDPASGLCGQTPAPVGTACSEGIAECSVGTCNAKGVCDPMSAPDGGGCNDYNACTTADKCASGICVGGSPVADCSVYLQEGFENCSNGWTLGGDWECGAPSHVGPLAAHLGKNCIATQIDENYHTNQSFNTTTATSPPVNLTGATKPILSFWAWDHTEGGSFDGWNLKVSDDGGTNYKNVTNVVPAYNTTILGQPAWGGNHAAEGWKNYQADLSAFIGKNILLRFAFRSDGATVFPGVYLDEVVVAEPPQIPLYITTTSPLQDVYSGMAFSAQINKLGGSSDVVWSIKDGQNAGWLTINSVTGVLSGTPMATDVGPVGVTVHVEEATLPSNYAEKKFTLNVKPNAYYTSFEGTCPDGWTLTGDWECGVPTVEGPATAYQGTQCLATQIDGKYDNLQTWAGTTATSPDIDLTNAQSPLLTFRMWIDTEGSTYDGAHLEISTDGGMTYSVLTSVSPAYTLTVGQAPNGQPAWGGHQAGLGWQFVQADLLPYAGKVIRLRFAFQSDSSGNFPGVYIDDIFIDN